MLTSRVLPPILRSPQLHAPSRLLTSTSRRDDIAPAQEPRMGTDAHRKHSEKEEKSATSSRRASKTMLTRSASSPSPARASKGAQSPPLQTSPGRLTRKRAASLVDTTDSKASSEERSPPSPKESNSVPSVGSGEYPGHVCLCQPEPKIPRPRNAFILYRQHHQQAVVTRNPGLANPEISKIIGEQWQAESDTVKSEWKALADEEKSRHLAKYPEYRYQPRRNGKPGALPENPSGQHTTVDKYRCPRCGGRSIRTPTSPFPTPQSTPLLPPPKQSPNSTSTTRFLPMMNSLSLESPHLRRPSRPGPSNLSSINMPASPVDTTMYSPLSPDSKRRRYNVSGYAPTSGRRVEGAPYYPAHGRRDSAQPIRQSPPNTGTMPPPRTPRRASAEMTLNSLPAANHDQSRSVEAMVMSVPYPVKIKVLGKITPPLGTPGLTSPANAVRGAIISIEGDDISAVQELCNWLNEFLKKDEFDVRPKMFDPPKLPDEDKREVTFADYLDIIKEWHGKSKEMIEYITTPVALDDTSKSKSKDDGEDKEMEEADKAEEKAEKEQAQTKPVVILPTYQLHASNVYTSRIPIADAYSPTDHWQWMATLWRGTVGPDLIIYIRDAKAAELAKEKMVELVDEIRCLTVRKEKGTAKVDGAALRRIGFEVGEWIRTVGQANGED